MSGRPLNGGKRRGRGEGTVEHRGGDRYRLRVYIGRDPVTGRPRQMSRTVRARTKTEALRELRRLASDAEEERNLASEASVAHLLTEYQKHFGDLAQTTREDYARVIKNHLVPELGALELRKLGVHDIDSYYSRKLAEGLKAKTIHLHKSILSGALDRAVDWGWIPVNPVLSSHAPKIAKVKKFTPEVDQVRKLIAVVESDWELAIAIVLAATTGARRGELCGLQWPDIDWDAGIITFRRQRVPVKGGDITGPLKWRGEEERRVPLGPLGLAMLRRYEQLTKDRASDLGIVPRWDGWLISRDCGRSPMNARGLGTSISEAGRKAKVPVTPHAFRRFATDQMLGAKVDVMVAAKRLGNTPTVMLKHYASALPEQAFAAAVELEALVLPAIEDR